MLVGLEMEGDEPVGHGDCVHAGRAQVGVITSATRSPILGKTIALARVDVTQGALGTQVEVGKLDGHQKRLPARVVRFPHYDPEKTGCVPESFKRVTRLTLAAALGILA